MSTEGPSFSAPVRRKERSLSSLGLFSTVSMPKPTTSMQGKYALVGGPPPKELPIAKDHDDRGEQGLSSLRSTRNDADDSVQGLSSKGINGNMPDVPKSIKLEDTESASASGWPSHYLGGLRPQESACSRKSSRSSSGIKHVQSHNGTSRTLKETDLPPLAYLAEVAEADAHRSETLISAGHSVPLILPRKSTVKKELKEEVLSQTSKCKVHRKNSWKPPGFDGISFRQETENVRRAKSHVLEKSADYVPSKIRARPKALEKNGLHSGAAKFCITMRNEKKTDVWFALKASENQTDDGALQQILTPYIRIRDGKLPVSLVKKYLARKLELSSETEVELTCRGQPVISSITFERVQNMWLASTPAAEPLLPKEEGSMRGIYKANQNEISKDVVMVLTYQRNRRTRVSHSCTS